MGPSPLFLPNLELGQLQIRNRRNRFFAAIACARIAFTESYG